MNVKNDQNVIKVLFGKNFLLVMGIGFLLSVVLIGASYIVPDIPSLSEALKQIGLILIGAVIASLIHEKVLGDYYAAQSRNTFTEVLWPNLKEVEEKLACSIDQILPEVKKETVASIEDIRIRVSTATEFMLNGIGVLTGAKIAGINNIFPTRYEKISGESVIDVISKDLRAENSHIRIMGISLGDYFLDRGVLHLEFVKLVEDSNKGLGPSIKALIVHPKCEALKERARWEAGQEYYKEPAFFDSTTFIETDGAARIARRLCEKFGKNLEIKLYKQSPTSFVLLTSRYAFIESYNYAARGSNVPVIQVVAGSSLYRYYESHFERIWAVSEPIGKYDPFESNEKKDSI